MNWTPDQRLAAIDIIALKLITEQNPFQRHRGLDIIRNLTWLNPSGVNKMFSFGIGQDWLTKSELQKIKSC